MAASQHHLADISDTVRIEGGPRPVEPIGLAQALEQGLGQTSPDSGALPVQQPSPPHHATAAAQFIGAHFPGDAAFPDKHDAGKSRAIGQARSPAFGLGRFGWQERFDVRPEFVTDQWFTYTPNLSRECKVLLGVLRQAG